MITYSDQTTINTAAFAITDLFQGWRTREECVVCLKEVGCNDPEKIVAAAERHMKRWPEKLDSYHAEEIAKKYLYTFSKSVRTMEW
jgi:hypothetical protein